MGGGGQHAGQHRPDQLIAAGELPQAAVEPHHREQDDGHDGEGRSAAKPAIQVVLGIMEALQSNRNQSANR